jgi:superkiller protein 3
MTAIKFSGLLAGLVLVVLVITPGCFDTPGAISYTGTGSSVDSYLHQAQGAEIIGSYPSAASYYSKALEIEPGNATALLGKSHAMIVLKRYAEALDASKKARAAIPSSPMPYIYEGVALDSLGRHLDAEQAFAAAFVIDPNITYARYLSDAAVAGEELDRNPDNASAWFVKGSAYYSLDLNGSYLQPNARSFYRYMAEASLKNATRLNPDNDIAWKELGSLYLMNFNYTASEDAYRRSLALNPANDGAWYGLAYVYELDGRTADRVSTIESGIARVPGSPELWLARARAYSSLTYSRMYNQSIDAGAYNSLNFTDETIRSYDRTTALDPGNDKAWSEKARFLSINGRLEDAISAWQAQLSLNRETSLGKANIYADIGDAYYQLRRYPEATQAYENAIRLYPDHERAKAGQDKAANPLLR